MNHRENARRPTADEQLLFDWSASKKTNDNQPVASATEQLPRETCAMPDVAHKTEPEAGTGEWHYDSGHPWHYYPEGDNAPAVPFDDVPPAEDYGRSLERELPRPAAKRIVKARELLASELNDLQQARTRYEDVIARGAEALSRYDREIAYGGNDELARAGTLALLFSQISWRRGRIAYLQILVSRQAARSR